MQNQNLIAFLLAEFHTKLNGLNEVIPRKASFSNVTSKIKVAIGMRRTGKTYLMFHTIKQLLAQGVALSQILYLNFEDDRLLPLTREKLAHLLDAFYAYYPKNHEKKCYLFLDEIQNVDDWALVIRRYFDSKPVEIYLTGSSAKLLSKEIATSLRGRSLSTEVWPYDFEEYLLAHHNINQPIFGAQAHDERAHMFRQYLENGGLPEVTFYDVMDREQTLQEYVTVVTMRDIIERYPSVNHSVLKYLIIAIINNVAKPFSVNKFYNDLKSQGFKVNKDSLYDYVQYIEDAFLAFSVPVYSESIRKSQVNPKKIYAIDTGLIRAMTLDYNKDFGRLFENLVYLDLRRQGFNVYYYLTQQRFEVDFLAQTNKGAKQLIQVCWDMTDSATRTREERALSAGMDELNVPGTIITVHDYIQNGGVKLL